MEPGSDVVNEVSVTLPVAVATPLAYALVDRIATEHGVRVLAIKGPLLEKLGLRAHKISTDADILVEPARMTEFCGILSRYGWNDRDVRFSPSILEPHSRTLIHEKWPSDIDVHSYFPGFFGPADQVFDFLWESRIQVELANVQVSTASREANAVIALLHLLRNSPTAEEHQQYGELMSALRATNGREQALALSRLADVGRFRSILKRELMELGVTGTFEDVAPQELARWEINRQTGSEATTGSWLYAISVAGGKSKIKVFLRAIYPSNDELRKDPGMAGSDTSKLIAARLRRLARGLRTLPSAALSIFRNWGTR